MSVLGVILVRIFPHLDGILFSANAENEEQNNTEYGHFSHSKWQNDWLIWQNDGQGDSYEILESSLQLQPTNSLFL